jgi:hypothetical protein
MDRHMQEAEYGSQYTSEGSPLQEPAKGEQRRTWDVPPGGIITDGAGRLRLHRPDTYHHPWSAVPVGSVAARKLSKGLNERDYLILLMAEKLQVITTEQVARVFFESHVTARKRIRLLRERRFLASPEVDHRIVSAAVGHRGGMHNASLVLDWNGKYLLEQVRYDLRTWDPATVAQANSRFGHTLGISEVWSFIAAAARATHDTHQRTRERASEPEPVVPGQSQATGSGVRDQMAVGLLNERESAVYYEGCTRWSLELEWAAAQGDIKAGAGVREERSKRWKYRPLVKPDATLVLSVTPDETERAYRMAELKSNSKSPSSYQGNWRDALLPAMPSPAAMRGAEHVGNTKYRYLFLEMETGSNSSKDLVDKIGRYNQLHNRVTQGDMMHGQSWRTLFGTTFPTIIVAVRDIGQIDGQVTLWRTHFVARSAGSVILANLELLSLEFDRGRSRLLTQPCWLDVMRPEGPKRMALSEILGLRISLAPH